MRALENKTALERLTHSHAEGVFVFAGCKIGAKIHVVSFAQHETQAGAPSRKEGIIAEEITTARSHAADAPEPNQTESLG